jgi:hypothetical protein
MGEGKTHYLPTRPGTQMCWEVPAWCAGHPWRDRRGLGWLHRLGHRARVLRVQAPRHRLVYIDSKPAEDQADNGPSVKCQTCSDRRWVSQPRRVWLGWALRAVPCPDCMAPKSKPAAQ